MATTKKLMGTTAAAGGGALAIEDVFSTYLYDGTGSSVTVTNGVDLANEGGMVWIKGRSIAYNHNITDTERGVGRILNSNTTSAETYAGDTVYGVSSFNSDGFATGTVGQVTETGNTFASWTFRKAPRFFDVVTYTGDGVAGRAISHNLGVTPGCIIVKATSTTRSWYVYHRGYTTYTGQLENTAAFTANALGGVSDTDFTTGSYVPNWNESGVSYVAYLFAHDPLGPSGDGSDGLIACGSALGGSNFVDLGWEPQWILMKTTATGSWRLVDSMRGLTADGGNATLFADLSNAEFSLSSGFVKTYATGFSAEGAVDSGQTYIYIAIRRGPMRQPTSGTEVFDAVFQTNTSPSAVSGFVTDASLRNYRPGGASLPYIAARLTGGEYLQTHSTATATTTNDATFDYMDGAWSNFGSSTSDILYYNFRRAPGFFDVVAYTGDGVAGRTVSHNLGVAPEMMIVKKRDGVDSWRVYHSGLNGGTTPENYFVNLNNANTEAANSAFWNNTAPASTEFTVGTNVNGSGANYIAYLFATLPGVSKVGSYTGNGGTGDINVDCGFTSGARFVLIKDATSANDWYVWDTARGIVAGNDPYLRLNSTGAETTDSDWVDPYSAGFTVTTGLYANLRINVLGNTYIYLAIA